MEGTRNTTIACNSRKNGTTICIIPYTSHPAHIEQVRYPTTSQTMPTYDILSGLTVLPDYAEMPRSYSTDSTSSTASGTQIFDQAGRSLVHSDPSYCHTNSNTLVPHNHSNIDITGHIESVVNITEIPERKEEPATKKRRTNSENYKRHPKPPYSYASMLILAIENSPNKRLTLTGIHAALKGFFEFFNGKYTGWKDSIRHNLSNSICFYKEKGPPEGVKSGKFSFFWRVDLSKVAPGTFLCQSNHIAREGDYEKELHEQLGLPRLVLPAATCGDKYGTSNNSHTAAKIEQPATVNYTHKPEVSTNDVVKTETTPACRLWNPCENTPVNIKVEQQHATKSTNLIKMALPLKSSSNSNVATDSPENLRMSDLVHAKRQNIKSEPMKSGSCETHTNIEQSPSFVTRKRHISREINELYTYVASTEHTSSADQAVNNLSLLCSVAQPRELTPKVDTKSEAHLAPPCFHTPTTPACRLWNPCENTPVNMEVEPQHATKSPCAYAFSPSSSSSARVCKAEPRVNSPVIQDQMAKNCMLDNYFVYNGYIIP